MYEPDEVIPVTELRDPPLIDSPLIVFDVGAVIVPLNVPDPAVRLPLLSILAITVLVEFSRSSRSAAGVAPSFMIATGTVFDATP